MCLKSLNPFDRKQREEEEEENMEIARIKAIEFWDKVRRVVSGLSTCRPE